MWNLSPLQSSRFSLEYLLLPPRSALKIIPHKFTFKVSKLSIRPPTPDDISVDLVLSGLCISNRLKRHPFSGLMNLASKLLRTS